MKKCPFCGADIEDSARFCLFCMQSLVEKEKILPHKKKKPQWLLIVAAIVGVLLACIVSALVIALFRNLSAPGIALPSATPSADSAPSSGIAASHIHSYTVENTANQYLQADANCLWPASYYYSCSCGEKGSDTFYWGETGGHIEVADPAIAASCTAAGLTAGKHCSVCNAVLVAQTFVGTKAHTEVIDQAVAPTCTNYGKTEGRHCSTCNTVLLAQINVPVISHTFDNDQDQTCNVCNYVRMLNCSHASTVALPAVSPTCITGGLTEGKQCSVCEEILVAQTPIAPLGHTEVVDQAVAATCTADGKTEGKHCATCNAILVKQVTVAAKGHTEVTDPAIAATCTATGLTAGRHCSVCGTVLVAQTVVDTKAHTEVIDPAVAPTCTSEGKTEGKHCSVCNAVLLAQTKIPVISHTFDNDRDKTCNVCNYTRTINCSHTEILTLPALSPTCIASGLTEGKQCSICEEILVAQTPLAPLGHTEVIDQAIAATCTTDGKTSGKHCAVCNAVLMPQVTVAAKGHTEVIDQAVPATCIKAGKTEGIHCSVCQTVIKAQTSISAFGHTIVVCEKGYPATCSTPGKTDGTICSGCGDLYEPPQTIPATGHVFTFGGSSCLDCGAEKTLTVVAPPFPSVLRNTFRIDGGTYSVKERVDGSWSVIFAFSYTNISSSITHLCPDVSLWGVIQAVCSYSSLAPNESGFFEASAYVYDPYGTYYLVFE